MTLAEEDIPSPTVVCTIVGGRVAFQRLAASAAATRRMTIRASAW
ncbi:MAG: hypothetical protein ABIP42_04765 [Planctomycetota bacterium]